MSYTYKKDWWETKDHKFLKIKDMDTSHIENTIKLLKRNPKFYDEEYSFWGGDSDGMFYDYEDNSYLVERKIDELEFELRLRKIEKEVE